MIFESETHGRLTIEQVFQQIKSDLEKYPNDDHRVIVGTDSQTYSRTKIVTVIAILRVGKGGKYFAHVDISKQISNIRVKVYNETYRSLEVSKQLIEFFIENDVDNIVEIHLDIGNSKKGKTYEMINEISGWVTAEGFMCYHKPKSFVASTIADRISK